MHSPTHNHSTHPYIPHTPQTHPSTHRTVSGILKGFDQLINLVLDESKETVRGTSRSFSLSPSTHPPTHLPTTDPMDPYRLTEETRDLGLVICRGTQVSLISPVEGTEEIANPFIQGEDEG